MAKRIPLAVDKSSGCWIPNRSLGRGGYVRAWNDGKHDSLHRVMYEQHKGSIPDGLELDHLCRNRACCNPDHLEPVTHRENMLRGIGFSAVNAVKTHCHKGHEFTPENTYTVPGRIDRWCRICKREANRLYAARLKASAESTPPGRRPHALLAVLR